MWKRSRSTPQALASSASVLPWVGEHQVRGERNVRRAQPPDVEVVHFGDPVQ